MLLARGCQLDSLRGRPLAFLEALQGARMAGITLRAAGNLAMTLCQAPWGWQTPHCSPKRAQRNLCSSVTWNGELETVLSSSVGLREGRRCSVGTHKDTKG